MKYEMIIETAEQLHALSHPLRQRILNVLISRELNNKQIADELGESAPKVHFHVKELLNAGIIQLTKEEVKGSIIEKKYTAAARSFRLSPSLELSKGDQHLLYESTFHATYRELIESLNYYEGVLPFSQISQEQAWLSKKEIDLINGHLSSINEILHASRLTHENEDGLSLYSLSYFFHQSSQIKSSSDDKEES